MVAIRKDKLRLSLYFSCLSSCAASRKSDKICLETVPRFTFYDDSICLICRTYFACLKFFYCYNHGRMIFPLGAP